MDDEDIVYITCTQFILSVGIQLTLCSTDPECWYIPRRGKNGSKIYLNCSGTLCEINIWYQ